MNFIVELPRTQAGYDSIWVTVDRLTKVAHFIPIKMTYSGAKLIELHMSRIVCLQYGKSWDKSYVESLRSEVRKELGPTSNPREPIRY
jgi:hypothetical protein